MSKKYELLTDQVYKLGDVLLHRIRALKTFGSVKKGELGGFVQNEANLSQDGNAWISDDAKVYGNARISGNALVSGNTEVHEYARVTGYAQVYGYARISDYNATKRLSVQ